LVIRNALHGLRTSGARFNEKLADIFRDFDFKPSYADSNLWIKDCGTYCEYIFTYVDDLMCFMKNPQAFFDALTEGPYTYKLYGVGDPKYHLGG
jgi:hypothetical protein